jgi:ankyrin repeat protein
VNGKQCLHKALRIFVHYLPYMSHWENDDKRRILDALLYMLDKIDIDFVQLSSKDKQRNTFLHLVAMYGGTYVQVAKVCIDKGVGLEAMNHNCMTALLLESEKDHLEVVKCLTEHGADVETRSNEDRTSLHLACMENNLSIVKYLVKNGANIEAGNSKKRTVLHLACYHGHLMIVKYLTENGAMYMRKVRMVRLLYIWLLVVMMISSKS